MAATFFLSKGRPPVLGVPQMFKFLKAFFGRVEIESADLQTFESEIDANQRSVVYH